MRNLSGMTAFSLAAATVIAAGAAARYLFAGRKEQARGGDRRAPADEKDIARRADERMTRRMIDEQQADRKVEEHVRAAIAGQLLDGSAIRVTAHSGRVTLRGTVASCNLDRLLKTLLAIPGVSEVDNLLDCTGDKPADYEYAGEGINT